MHRLLFLFISLLLSSLSMAQSHNTLIVYTINDSQYKVSISEGATMSFSENVLSITHNGTLLLNIDLSSVSHWETVHESMESLDETTRAPLFNIEIAQNILRITSPQGPVPITVALLDGTIIYSGESDNAEISLERYPGGIYIVNVINQTLKLCKK